MLGLAFDVHGNLGALEAVLADARSVGVERWVLGGDYALFGSRPAECVALLRGLDAVVMVRGNGERWTATPSDAPGDPVVQEAIAACRAALGDAEVADLAGLPFEGTVGETRVVHASPVSDVRSFLPEPAPDEGELLAGVHEPRLVFGHTHLPFVREAGGVTLVNPGSVGMPLDGDTRAAWAVLHDDGRVEHRRVAYDVEEAAARVRDIGGWGDVVARRIERAQFAV